MDQLNISEVVSGSQNALQLPCIFCLKPTFSLTETLDGRFLICVSQFLGNFSTDNYTPENSNFCCCADCSVLVNLFCEQYSQWQCLKLKVHWTAERLVNIVKLAGKVPSRKLQLNRILQNFETCKQSVDGAQNKSKLINNPIEVLKKFQKDFVKKCTQKRANLAPRICLPDIYAPKGMKQDLDNLYFSNGIPYFLGWIFTSAVVILLATECTERNLYAPVSYDTELFEVFEEDEFSLAVNEYSPVNTSFVALNNSPGLFELDSQIVNEHDDYDEFVEENLEKVGIIGFENYTEESSQSATTSETLLDKKCSTISVDDHNNECSGKNEEEVKPDLKPVNTKGCLEISCKQCSETFRNKFALRRHSKTVHTTRTYKCRVCTKSFWCYDKLRWHKLHSNIHQMTKRLLKFKTAGNERLQTDTQNPKTEQKSKPLREKRTEKIRQNASKPFVKKSRLQKSLEKANDLGNEKTTSDLGENVTTPVASMSSSPAGENAHSYSLRASRKRSYKNFANSDCDSEEEYKLELDSSSSSESEDTSSDDEQKVLVPIKTKISSAYCKLDGCRIHFRGGKYDQRYTEHQKLHKPGRYKCHFCSTIEGNIAKLARHEMFEHSRTKFKRCKEWIKFCSRCKFETLKANTFLMHFAETHIGGFNSRKGNTNFVECEICMISVFNNPTSLGNHFKSYHDISQQMPNEIFNCSVKNCKAYFLKNSQKLKHERVVHNLVRSGEEVAAESEDDNVILENASVSSINGKMEFKCNLCDKQYDSLRGIRLHEKVYHAHSVSDSIKKVFVCPVFKCPKSFKTEMNLNEHKKLHGNFQCNFCNVVKDYAPDLALHELEHENLSVPQTKNLTQCKWKCCRCLEKQKNKPKYIRHFLATHLQLLSDKSKKCQICNLVLHRGAASRNHQKTHHKKEDGDASDFIRCHLCTAYFVTGAQLSQHLSKFHWHVKCPDCGKGFAHWPDPHARLEKHLEQFHPHHVPHLKFACDNGTCYRKFSLEAELIDHKMKNKCESLETQKCTQCGKECKSSLSLYAHIRNVHASRSFVCEECGKAFKSKLTLSFHMEFHKDPKDWKWQCSECDRKCATKQKLDQHKRTHTKEKPFICQYCGEKYAHRHNWKNHVKTKHPEEEEMTGSEQPVKGNYMSRKGSKKGECIIAGAKQK